MTYGVTSARVRFGDRTALDDVTVRLPPGSVTAVVGGDGAGKTTLMRALVREVVRDAGTVNAPEKAGLGYLPASSGSWAALTVTQNVEFAGGIFGLDGEALASRRDELLAAAGLTAAADRPASELSGGMRRKLGFCMTMLHRPSLLVLDEPRTGVDPLSRGDRRGVLSEAAARGAAVVMSTTYLDEAERAGQLLVLDGGRVLLQGTYDDVRAGFVGTITRGPVAVRPEWSWRRGRERQEYWPASDQPADRSVVDPDLEDLVVALSLTARNRDGAAA